MGKTKRNFHETRLQNETRIQNIPRNRKALWRKRVLIFIGVLLLLNIALLSLTSNFHMGYAMEGFVGVALILYALIFDRIPGKIHRLIWGLCIIPFLLMVSLGIYGNCNNAQYDEDAVIVLGAGIHGEQVTLPLAQRLDQAVMYYNKNPRAVIVVCGGQGFQETISEAMAMERYLIAQGVPPEKIFKEDQSTSTYENLTLARNILNEQFPQGFSSVVITNDFHIFRAAQLARRAGIPAKHVGAYTDIFTWPSNYLREILAIGKMLLLNLVTD